MATTPPDATTKCSLAQHLKEHHHATTPPLAQLLSTLAAAGQEIGAQVSSAHLRGTAGAQGTHNPSGDVQQQLDVIAHDSIVNRLLAVPDVCAIISEEAEGIISPRRHGQGSYVVALDPLDGSLNLGVNAPVGTLFSIWQRTTPQGQEVALADVLQAGEQQLAAGYILYGTAPMFVYTARRGVHGFTHDPATQAFVLTHPAIQMPLEGKSYAVNDGYFLTFPACVQQYIHHCRQRRHAARYAGALVADFHRHLLQGGIYMYPPTANHPAGKLRLLLECNALSLIAEQAGGMASNGSQPVLSVRPHHIHQRTPLYVGSAHMVETLLSCTA